MMNHGGFGALQTSKAPEWGPRSYEVHESLPIALVRAREAITPHLRPTLRQHRLTDLQWRVLLMVRSYGEVEVARLAQLSCLLPPSLSRVLKDLLNRNLILRRAPASDQRRSLISLSEEGAKLMAQVFPKVLDGYEEIERIYGAEKLAELREMLTDLWSVLAKQR